MRGNGLVAVALLASCAAEVVDPLEARPPVSAQARAALTSGFTGPLTTNAFPVLAPQADGTVVFSSWTNTASWNPATNQWTAKAPPPNISSALVGAALTDGKVMRGGSGAPGTNGAALYDPATNTWLQSTFSEAKNNPAIAQLRDGSALIAGGIGGSSAERFNVATNTWTTVGTLSTSSTDELRLLRDGRVVVPSSSFMSAYDAQWNITTFLAPANLSTSAAVELEDGKVLFVGPTVWRLLDLDGLTWLESGALTPSRTDFALVRLTDGRAMRIGGTVAGVSTATSEIFDPLTRTWSVGPSMLQARSRFAVHPVAPGFLMIAGGGIVNGLTTNPVPSAQGAELLDVGCVPVSCAQRQYTCGATTDGCGQPLDCGGCGGVCSNNKCVTCAPATCVSLSATCGSPSDGCGGTLNCGTCPSTQTCSASNRCETIPGLDRTATWNGSLQLPQCSLAGRSCDTGTLVTSRGPISTPEPAFPNTLSSSCADGASGLFHSSPSLDRVVVRSPTGWLGDGPIQLDATVWVTNLSERLDVFIRPTSDTTWTLKTTVAPTALGQQVLTTSFTVPFAIPTYVRTQYRASASAVSCTTGAFDDRDDLLFPVQLPDVQPPLATFSSPAVGATLRGSVSVTGISSNEASPTTQVFDGTTLLFTSTQAFWSGTWNTLNASQGTHQLFLRASDAVGNVRTSLNLTVQVDNAPLVSVTAPSQGTTVNGTAVTLSASASAVTGRTLSGVEFFVDGASVGTSSAAPWEVSWNSRSVGNGAHVVTARATDSAGLVTTSSGVNVTTDNDLTAPVVTLVNPAANAVLRGVVGIDANASDASAITSVEVFDGVALVASGTAAPWSFSWDTSGAAQGGHTLRVVATDAYGNVGEASLPVVVDNAPVVAVTSPTAAQVVNGTLQLDASVSLGGTHTLSALTWILDGNQLTTLNAPPWSLTWDSRSVINGAHTLSARAFDSFGLQSQSVDVGFTTNNDFDAPVVALTAPAAGALVGGSVPVQGTFSDASALGATRVAIDGVTLASGLTSPFSVAWNTAGVSDGVHVIRLEATDAFSQLAFAERTVTVDNTLPVVAMTAPTGGLVGGVVALTASASDVSGVTQVQFFANGALVGVDSSSPFSVSWNAGALSGAYALTAVATDGAGNVRASAAVNVTVAGVETAVYSSTFKAPRCGTAATSCSTGATLVNGRGTVGPEVNRPNTLSASCTDGNSGTFHGTGESIDKLEVMSVSGGPIVPGVTVRVRATVWATQSTNRVDFYSAANATSPSWTLRATATPSTLNGVTTVETTFVLPAGASQAVRAAMRRGGSASTCPSGSFNDRDDLVFVTQ